MSSDRLDAALTSAAALATKLERTDISRLLGELQNRRRANEWFVLVLGETSTGKSSWINTLLQETVLPATPGATTGVPVEIRWSRNAEPQFAALGRDGIRRPLSREEFAAACTSHDDDTLRTYVDWPVDRRHDDVHESELLGLVVVDAPGYNSCVTHHAEILRDVLPEADAVLAFVNAARGVTPHDLEFMRLVRKFDDGGVRLAFVVNWLPPSGGAARLGEMRARLAEGLGTDFPLHPLAKTGAGRTLRLWSADAWCWLLEIAQASERRNRVDQNVALVGSGLLEQLAETLSLRARVAAMEQAKLSRVDDAIADLEQKRAAAAALIFEAEREMHAATDSHSEAGRDELWNEADSAIGDANRFLDVNGCTTWVRSHLLPLHFDSTTQRLTASLEQIGDRVAEQIEDLFAEAELPELPDVEANDPDWDGTRDYFARRGVHAAATELIASQLAAFGGRGGAKAGFYNLSKKVVSKVGRVFGRKFSRAFYNNLGRALRGIGLSAGTAMALFAAVVLEAATYLYQVVRWKAKLRGVMQHTLGLPAVNEPIEDSLLRRLPIVGGVRKRPFALLAAEARSAVSEAMTASREIIDSNFSRRADVLAKAVASRRSGSMDGPSLKDSLRELKSIANTLKEESQWETTTD